MAILSSQVHLPDRASTALQRVDAPCASDVCVAREVIAAPHRHTAEDLRIAIAVLETCGDWMDRDRAKLLRLKLDEEAKLAAFLSGAADVIDTLVLFALLVGGLWVSDYFGWM